MKQDGITCHSKENEPGFSILLQCIQNKRARLLRLMMPFWTHNTQLFVNESEQEIYTTNHKHT